MDKTTIKFHFNLLRRLIKLDDESLFLFLWVFVFVKDRFSATGTSCRKRKRYKRQKWCKSAKSSRPKLCSTTFDAPNMENEIIVKWSDSSNVDYCGSRNSRTTRNFALNVLCWNFRKISSLIVCWSSWGERLRFFGRIKLLRCFIRVI